jgi:hypothetical protein
MRFVHLTFLITLWNKIRDALPHISKVHRPTLIRSIGHSKFKTIATKQILSDEFERLLSEPDLGDIVGWMEAASELRMIKTKD